MKRFIATFFGIGLLPGMPGTYASFAAAAIYFLVWRATPENARFVMLGLTVVVAVLAPIAWKWAHECFQSQDPRQYVWDEVIGQWIALLCIPLTGPVLSYIAVGFFLFRGFDVAKPWPIKHVERIPRAWGAILDDVAAGGYSIAGFWLLLWASRALAGG